MASPDPSPAPAAARTRALRVALWANAAFLFAEVGGGLMFGSLALLADGVHMLSDVAALAIALVAERLASRPATPQHSYGLRRAEVLGAQVNAVVLLAASGWIVLEAIWRFGAPSEIHGTGVLIVGALGLAVNVGSMVLLHRAAAESLNMRAAYLHMLADAAGSVAVIVAAVVVIVWGAHWVDPLVSLLIAALVLRAAWHVLRDTTHVLLEGTPRHIDPAEVTKALGAEGGVEDVHHLHIWNVASDETALSVHVRFEGGVSLHDAQSRCVGLKDMLAERFGIRHATVELECHACDETPVGADAACVNE